MDVLYGQPRRRRAPNGAAVAIGRHSRDPGTNRFVDGRLAFADPILEEWTGRWDAELNSGGEDFLISGFSRTPNPKASRTFCDT